MIYFTETATPVRWHVLSFLVAVHIALKATWLVVRIEYFSSLPSAKDTGVVEMVE